MSYILDALKKIEHEKNRRVQTNGRVNLAGELFREQKPRTGSGGFRRVVIPVAAACLLTCAGTWFVLSGKKPEKADDVRQPEPAIQRSLPPVIPAAPLPVPIQTPPAPPAAVPAPVTAPVVSVPTVQKTVETAADEGATSRRSVRRVVKRTLQQAPPKQTVPSVPAPADIKLSGIAWQDERSARRAVVNGFLLKEGAAVSGATVSDIQADRVRFTSPAGSFEIRLDAALPAEVKK